MKSFQQVMYNCGGRNDSVAYRLSYPNTWSPAGRAVWGSLGGVVLLEEVFLWD